MKCENIKCNIEHDGSFGSGRFCSKGCANSRCHSDETKSKTSNSIKKLVSLGLFNRPTMTKEQIEVVVAKRKIRAESELLDADFTGLKFERLRKRVVLEQSGHCNKCGNHEWLSEPIMLELEHIDGDNKNNVRENLECLCPNCHSQTKTWRGRNKVKGKTKMDFKTDSEIVTAYSVEGNIRKTLLSLGLAAKGSNYGRVKRVLTLYGIPYNTGR